MSNSINLSKMIFDADYEALDYRQLVELDLAFTWASGIINSLLPVKKQKAVDEFTYNYQVKHSEAGMEPCASIAKPVGSIKEDAINSTNSKKGTVLEHPLSIEECPEIVKQAIEMADSLPVADGIIVDSPYFMCYMFKMSKGELILMEKPYGWNMPTISIEKLKTTEPLYANDHYKTTKTYCIGDYVVSMMVNNQYRVCYFKTDGVEMERTIDESVLPDDVRREMEVVRWWNDNYDSIKESQENSPAEEAIAPEEDEWADNAVIINVKPSDQTKKKDPRSRGIIGSKDGVTKRWNSFRECEKDLGVSPGTASQVVSGKMKSAKGWVLKKADNRIQEQ